MYMNMPFCMSKLYTFTIYLLKNFVVNISCQAAALNLNSVNISNVIIGMSIGIHRPPNVNLRKMTRRDV